MSKQGVIVGLTAALVFASTAAGAQTVMLQPGETLLEVNAEGEARAAPNVTTLRGGVVSTGVTAREAIAANTTAMSNVIDALVKAGVDRRGIQTSEVDLDPRMETTRDSVAPPRILGYVARNTVNVRLGRIVDASNVITAMFDAGANSADGPYFRLENDVSSTAAARADAVAKARVEAEDYASAFNMRISRVLRISERGVNQQYRPIVVAGSRADGIIPPPVVIAVPGVPVSVGEVLVTTNLWVDFALVPR